MPKCFGLAAGETSGAILGAGLIRSLNSRFPDAHFLGVVGPHVLSARSDSLTPRDRLAELGFVAP